MIAAMKCVIARIGAELGANPGSIGETTYCIDRRGRFDAIRAGCYRICAETDGHRPLSCVMAMFATPRQYKGRRRVMPNSVYKIIELVGTSPESWELAAKSAVERAGQSLRDLRVAEVIEQDLVVEDGKVKAYRSRLKVSFKYEGGA